jgi:hypothetical protein
MPRRDGLGPSRGGARGGGKGVSRVGSGGGRMGGNRPGSGPSGDCVCPSCGAQLPHQVGKPCNNLNCPKCGQKMIRA